MKKIVLCLLILTLITGCKKNDKVSALDTKVAIGGLSGTIVPAVAVTQITATSTGGKASYVINVDPITGKFSRTDLEDEDYLLSFYTDAKYEKIADWVTKVTAGKNIDLGIVTTKQVVNPAPTNIPVGSLSGSIKPLGAVTSISIFSEGAIGYVRMYKIPLDPVTGKFGLENIPEGNYSLYIPAAQGFNDIDQIRFKITADKNTDLGVISFTVTTEVAVGHTLSCNVNGESIGWMLSSVMHHLISPLLLFLFGLALTNPA